MKYSLDFETRSRADIKEVGAYRYAADPSTEILMFAISRNEEPPLLWDCVNGGELALRLYTDMHIYQPDAVCYAQNAQFERAIEKYLCEKTFGLKPLEITQWRCTAAMCRRAAIPFSLDGASQFLNLTQKKDKAGSVLIKLFSCIQTSGPYKGQFLPTSGSHKVTVNGTKMTIDEAWHLFGEYCLQDVRTEQAIAKALKAVELKGDVLEAFHFDMRMNERGVPINVDGVHKALKLVEEYNVPKAEEFRQLTGLNPTQRDKVFEWLKERGYPYQELTAAVVEHALQNPAVTGDVRKVLELRQVLSFAAVKKLPAMVDTVCEDNRIRGSLLWSGALRTHRWSGRLIQPQNMRKPSFKGSDKAYLDICNGVSLEYLDAVYAPPLEVVASCIRNFIHDPEYQMLDADYSGIEARILAWICCQWDLLDAFKQGRDVYKEMAAKIFNVEVAAVTKDQRFVGKTAILGCGYSTGSDKYKEMCAGFGVEISQELAVQTVKTYREANSQIVAAWGAFGLASVQAVKAPGTRVVVPGLAAPVSFCYHLDVLPFPALTMKLPSGHVLVYPKPELHAVYKMKQYSKTKKDKYTWVTIPESYAYEGGSKYPGGDWDDDDIKHSGRLKDGVWKTEEMSYYGQLPMSTQWGQVRTHGAKYIEQGCQAIGGDFITNGAINAERQGYEIFMLVHDQALAPYKPEQGNTKQGFSDALCKLPEWAAGFPLESTCDIVPFYLKED